MIFWPNKASTNVFLDLIHIYCLIQRSLILLSLATKQSKYIFSFQSSPEDVIKIQNHWHIALKRPRKVTITGLTWDFYLLKTEKMEYCLRLPGWCLFSVKFNQNFEIQTNVLSNAMSRLWIELLL